MNKILIATKNKGKVEDFKVLFEPKGIEVVSLLDLDQTINDIEETGKTFSENAILKSEAISSLLQMPVISDDSGLEVDALDGDPGVYSARYAGLEKDDQANIDKVLSNLKDINENARSARFVCAIALSEPGKDTSVELGYCEGTILTERRGKNGFGYDPIFKPLGYNCSMAELSPDEKAAISHRGNALRKIADWLDKR